VHKTNIGLPLKRSWFSDGTHYDFPWQHHWKSDQKAGGEKFARHTASPHWDSAGTAGNWPGRRCVFGAFFVSVLKTIAHRLANLDHQAHLTSRRVNDLSRNFVTQHRQWVP
jgi:hypothetical protein